MKTRKMPWFEFAPDTYEIDEFDCASIFLFVGTERALLLDTGIGIGDLKGLVEEITDKPYDVVLTHGHRDHTGGAGWFDTVYLNRKDYELYPFPPTVEQRRDYARMIRAREHKYYPYKEEVDIVEWPKIPERKPLEDGQVFDLGGRTLTFYECGGHTPGEMVVIDDKNRILFCGDACNNHLLFRLGPGEPGFISTEEAGENLERIWNMKDRYDIVMNSHHDYRAVGGPIAPTVMPNAIQCCKDLVAGTPHLMQIDNPLKLEGADPTITVASLDGISWVVFNPEGIHRV